MDEDEWFLFEGGQQLGPFTREQLVARLASHRRPDTLVCRRGMASWVRPEEYPELGLRRPPPPPMARAPQGGEEDRTQEFSSAFRALAQAYGAAVRTDGDELAFETSCEGIRVSIRCEPGSSDADLTVTARAGPHPPLRIYREGGFERIGKRLGFNREVQTGDEEFDREVYLDTPLPAAAVRDITGRPAFRRGVLTLLQQGFGAVEIDHDGLSIDKDVEHSEELARPRLDQTISAVALVATSLREIDPAWSRHRRSEWPWWLAGIGAVAAVAGVVALIVANKVWPPTGIGLVLLGLGGGGVAWAAAVALLIRLLWGRTDALFHLTLSGVLLLVALPSLGAAGLVALNGALDRSPPVVHQTVLRNKATSVYRGVRVGILRSRHRRYYVTVDDGLRVRRLSVPRAIYDRVEPGSPLTVVTRRGALGWEWDEKVP